MNIRYAEKFQNDRGAAFPNLGVIWHFWSGNGEGHRNLKLSVFIIYEGRPKSF